MNVLVVGANGQLGAACCRALAAEGHVVRGSVRELSRAEGLDLGGAELRGRRPRPRPGRRRAPRRRGCRGAHRERGGAAGGRRPPTLRRGRGAPRGSRRPARRAAGGAPVGPGDRCRRPGAARRRAATARAAGPLGRARVGGAAVPAVHGGVAGARRLLPALRGEPNATAGRASPSLRRYRGLTGSLVERRGLLLVPGPTAYRQAFIAVADVAAACVAAVDRPEVGGQTLELAGPEVLSWAQVADPSSGCSGAGSARCRRRRRCSPSWPPCWARSTP